MCSKVMLCEGFWGSSELLQMGFVGWDVWWHCFACFGSRMTWCLVVPKDPGFS